MLDLVIAIVFLLYGAGLANRHKASTDLKEYFLAGRTVRGWKSGLSMAATQFAADTPLLVTAPLLLYFFGVDPDLEWLRPGLMALISTTVVVGVVFVTPRNDPAVLVAFHMAGATRRILGADCPGTG